MQFFYNPGFDRTDMGVSRKMVVERLGSVTFQGRTVKLPGGMQFFTTLVLIYPRCAECMEYLPTFTIKESTKCIQVDIPVTWILWDMGYES